MIRIVGMALACTALAAVVWHGAADEQPSGGIPRARSAMHAADGDADGGPSSVAGGGPRARGRDRVAWRGATLSVPAGWRRLGVGEGWVTWGAADRTGTVTLASLPAADDPLAVVVAASRRELGDELPGAHLGAVRTWSTPDGGQAATSEVVARPGGRRVGILQAWRRDQARGVDLVATWTGVDGAAALRSLASIPEPDPE